jgi:hypothetical protein
MRGRASALNAGENMDDDTDRRQARETDARDTAGDGPEDEAFERTGQPGTDPDLDLRVPRLGGHVGGSDPPA